MKRSLFFLVLALVLLSFSVSAYEYLGYDESTNSYSYSLSEYGGVNVQQLEVDSLAPASWDPEEGCIVAKVEDIDTNALGITTKELDDLLVTDGIIDKVTDDVKVAVDSTQTKLSEEDYAEITSVGIPLKNFASGSGETPDTYWSDFTSDFSYCPSLTSEGIIEFGLHSSIYNITTFTYGTCSNCIIDPVQGVELINNHGTVNPTTILYYPFNVRQGGNNIILDATSNQLNGSLVGATYQFNRYKFANSYINITNYTLIDGTGVGDIFTYSFWARLESTDTQQPIFDQDTNIMFKMRDGGDFYNVSTYGASARTAYTFNTNQWYKIDVVWTEGVSVLTYVNGELVSTDLLVDTSGVPQANFTLGKESLTGFNLSGSLDEFKISNVALTQAEIRGNFSQGLFQNVSAVTANYTGSINARSYANYHQWINATPTCANNWSVNENCSYSYRTGAVIRVNVSDPSLVSYWPLNWNASDGSNISNFVDLAHTQNITCQLTGNGLLNACPNSTFSLFEGENASYFGGKSIVGGAIYNVSFNVTEKSSGDARYNMSTNFTVTFCAKTGAFPPTSPTMVPISYGTNLGCIGQKTCGGWNVEFVSEANGAFTPNFRASFMNGSRPGFQTTATTAITLEEEWHCYEFGMNNTRFYLYQDGVEKRSTLTDGQVLNMSFTNVGVDMCIGAGAPNSGVGVVGQACGAMFQYNGSMYGVAIYNKSFSDAEHISWQAWSTFYPVNGSKISITTVPTNNFLQQRIAFTSGVNNVTPLLTSMAVESNYMPTQGNPMINSSNGLNTTYANISVFNVSTSDTDNDSVKNIYSWCRKNLSFEVLVAPLETATADSNARDYSCNNMSAKLQTSPPMFNATGGYDGRGAYNFTNVASVGGIQYSLNASGNNYSELSKEFTMTAWIKYDRVQTLNFNGILKLFSTNNSRFVQIDTTSGTALRFRFDTENGSSQAVGATDNLASFGDGKPHFIALRYKQDFNNSNATLNMDMNHSTTKHITGTQYDFTHGTILIGGSSGFPGVIDEVRVYNISLSDEQLFMIYNNETNKISSKQLAIGDNWVASITPNDGFTDGSKKNVSMIINSLPTQGNPFINSTLGTNTSTENITVFNTSTADIDGDTVKSMYSWLKTKNGVTVPQEVLVVDCEEGGHFLLNGKTSVKDYSFNNITGVWTGSPQFNYTGGFDGRGACNVSQATNGLRFNINSSAYNQTAGLQYQNLSTNFSMMLWFKGSPNTSQNFPTFIGLKQANDSDTMRIVGDSSYKVRVRVDTSNITNNVSSSIGNISNYDWHFMAMTYAIDVNGSNLRLFVDNATTNLKVTGTPWSVENGTIVIFANGLVDGIRVYPYAVSDEQIYMIQYNQTNKVSHYEINTSDVWLANVVPNDGREDGANNTATITIVSSSSTTLATQVQNIYWASARTFTASTIRWFSVYFETNVSTDHAATLIGTSYNNTAANYITSLIHPETRQMATQQRERR